MRAGVCLHNSRGGVRPITLHTSPATVLRSVSVTFPHWGKASYAFKTSFISPKGFLWLLPKIAAQTFLLAHVLLQVCFCSLAILSKVVPLDRLRLQIKEAVLSNEGLRVFRIGTHFWGSRKRLLKKGRQREEGQRPQTEYRLSERLGTHVSDSRTLQTLDWSLPTEQFLWMLDFQTEDALSV